MKKKIVSIIVSVIFGVIGGALTFILFFNFVIEDGKFNYTEKIVERNVYVEESAVNTAIEKVSDSLMAVVNVNDLNNYKKIAGVSKDICLRILTNEDCDIDRKHGVIISNDGYILITGIDQNLDEYIALDHELNSYGMELIDSSLDYNFVVARLIPLDNQEVDFDSIEFAELERVRTGQKIISIAFAGSKKQNLVFSAYINSLSGRNLNGIKFLTAQASLPFALSDNLSIDFKGSPILNLGGQMLAINSENGLMDVDYINSFLNQIENKEKIFLRDWKFSYLMLTREIMNKYDLSYENGALLISAINSDGTFELNSVKENGIAKKLGLLSGDLIVEVDGIVLTEDRPLDEILKNKEKGDRIRIKIVRDGERIDLEGIL
ncbi:PDZ domain-containing protein [Candidatus Peregrinibacteria bacterium]|nr:PDZ domain-containing protein [Candidatus Peregrinibacteria bacterium]